MFGTKINPLLEVGHGITNHIVPHPFDSKQEVTKFFCPSILSGFNDDAFRNVLSPSALSVVLNAGPVRVTHTLITQIINKYRFKMARSSVS